MNELVIHIGYGKTGTSSIQNFLFSNFSTLKSMGWYYPNFIKELGFKNYKETITNRISYERKIKDDVLVLEKYRSEELNRIENHIKNILENYNVIISDEFLSADEEYLIQFLKSTSIQNIKIIVYLRRQDLWMESYYNQMIKGRRCLDTWEEFIENISLNYLRLLKNVKKYIPADNIIVRVYEKGQLVNNDIVMDFAKLLGMEEVAKNWSGDFRMNESLTINYLKCKMLINRFVINSERYMLYKRQLLIANELDRKKNQKNICRFFDIDERKKFYLKFKEENEIIAKEYMNRVDGRLFFDENMEFEKSEVDYNKVCESLLFLSEQVSEIDHVRKSAYQFLTLYSTYKVKKLCLFGAGEITRWLLTKSDINVEYIIDNDCSKKGNHINGIPIVHIDDVNLHEYYIVIACIYGKEISEQLKKLGLKEIDDYIYF